MLTLTETHKYWQKHQVYQNTQTDGLKIEMITFIWRNLFSGRYWKATDLYQNALP